MLYLREGQDPHFQLLLNMPRGDLLADVDEQEPEPELHLNRFRGLRARLRTALPALGRVSDPTLLALLCAMGANNVAGTVKHVAGLFAFTRLMKGHPQRGDGKPTAAERALAALCDGYGREEAGAPYDLGKRPGGDAALEPGCHLHMGWINVRGLCVPDAIVDGVRPALEKAVPLLDAFHRGA